MNISFIGFGNMAKSIANKLAQDGGDSLSAAAPSLTQGTNKNRIRTHYDNKEIVKDAEMVILAVKPVQMSVILKEITPYLPSDCLLISLAAGLSLPWFAQYCKASQAVIRTMPNTPASVGLAATPMIANQYVSPKQKKQAELIFSKIGITAWTTDEEDIDTFTALSGSGPAYVFLFLEAMIEGAVELGLDESTAKTFALQTFRGAIELAQNSDLSLTQLRTKVTSPGGTTAAAIAVLQEQLDGLIFRAMKAAKERAYELGMVE